LHERDQISRFAANPLTLFENLPKQGFADSTQINQVDWPPCHGGDVGDQLHFHLGIPRPGQLDGYIGIAVVPGITTGDRAENQGPLDFRMLRQHRVDLGMDMLRWETFAGQH
jgi:hypothetical protein